MEIQTCSNKDAGLFGGPIMGKINKILINLLLMNYQPECNNI